MLKNQITAPGLNSKNAFNIKWVRTRQSVMARLLSGLVACSMRSSVIFRGICAELIEKPPAWPPAGLQGGLWKSIGGYCRVLHSLGPRPCTMVWDRHKRLGLFRLSSDPAEHEALVGSWRPNSMCVALHLHWL